MELKKKISIQKVYKTGEIEHCEDEILIEYVFSIYMNDRLLVELLTLPKNLNELVIGYLYTEKMINSFEDIESINVDIENARADIKLNVKYIEKETLVTNDSGDYKKIPYQFVESTDIKRLNKIEYNFIDIINNFQKLMCGSELFKNTGNVHSVLLCKGSETLYFMEDIGRYNAFDKVVGAALKDGIDLSECIIYTSGRIPSTIAMKAIRVGIPIIVSRSAPSDKTLNVAQRYNLGVIGFTNKEKFNVYNIQN